MKGRSLFWLIVLADGNSKIRQLCLVRASRYTGYSGSQKERLLCEREERGKNSWEVQPILKEWHFSTHESLCYVI
jgi:hypothetical protein